MKESLTHVSVEGFAANREVHVLEIAAPRSRASDPVREGDALDAQNLDVFMKQKTYADVVKQIEALKTEADALRRKEVDGVVTRIKEAIAHYGLSAADLGLAVRSPGATAGVAGTKKRRRRRAKSHGIVKFRDASGNIWGGRGPRPRWLREALLAGKSLADFAV